MVELSLQTQKVEKIYAQHLSRHKIWSDRQSHPIQTHHSALQ